MKFEKLNGLVIKEVNTNDADKILTVLTDTKGKISVFAKGARRSKSGISLSAQLLCYSNFVLFKGRDMYYLNSANLIEHFYFIREDIVKLVYSSHLLEIIFDSIQENQQSEDVLKLLVNTLYMIEKSTNKSFELITSIFELKLISLLGFTPDIFKCVRCEKKVIDHIYFSYINNGLLCNNCYDKKAFRISNGTLQALNYILCSDIKNIFRVVLSEELTLELRKVTSNYLNYVLEKKYNRLKMLKQL